MPKAKSATALRDVTRLENNDGGDCGFPMAPPQGPAGIAYVTAPFARRVNAIFVWPRRSAHASGAAPGLVIGKIGGRTACEEELYHRRRIGACRPGKRRRPTLVISGRYRGAGVEQNGRTFDGPASAIRPITDEVQ